MFIFPLSLTTEWYKGWLEVRPPKISSLPNNSSWTWKTSFERKDCFMQKCVSAEKWFIRHWKLAFIYMNFILSLLSLGHNTSYSWGKIQKLSWQLNLHSHLSASCFSVYTQGPLHSNNLGFLLKCSLGPSLVVGPRTLFEHTHWSLMQIHRIGSELGKWIKLLTYGRWELKK